MNYFPNNARTTSSLYQEEKTTMAQHFVLTNMFNTDGRAQDGASVEILICTQCARKHRHRYECVGIKLSLRHGSGLILKT